MFMISLTDEALLCGIILGDGCVSKFRNSNGYENSRIIITLAADDGRSFIKRIFVLLEKISNRKPYFRFKLKYHCIEILVSSKEACDYLKREWNFSDGKKIKIKIPEKFLKRWNLTKKVLAGLFATDGTVIFAKQHKNVPYLSQNRVCEFFRRYSCSNLWNSEGTWI